MIFCVRGIAKKPEGLIDVIYQYSDKSCFDLIDTMISKHIVSLEGSTHSSFWSLEATQKEMVGWIWPLDLKLDTFALATFKICC